MVPISASQRRLKTALDIIFACTKFQKSKTRAGRERCKNADGFGDGFGKAEGGPICNSGFKGQPVCQIRKPARRPNMEKRFKPWLRMRAAQRERLNQISGTLGVDAPY